MEEQELLPPQKIEVIKEIVANSIDGLNGSVNADGDIVFTHPNMFDENGNKKPNKIITFKNGFFVVVDKK